MKRSLKILAGLLLLVSLYPVLVWGYCIADDYIFRRDTGKWEYHRGTFWHTYHFADGSDPQYDRQIDLCCPSALITAVVFGIIGSLILLRCLSLASALGGLESGDFLQYYSIGTDPNTGKVWVDDYPTGEAPWYVYCFHGFPAWSLGFGCLGLSTASVVTYRKLRKQL